MTPPAATATDDQLKALAVWIARMCLEVERGHRDPSQLSALGDPRARRPTADIQRHRFTKGGHVTKADIGPPQISRLTDDRAIANIVTRTEGRRWGSLTITLQARGDKWRIADVRRLLASHHYRTDIAQRTVDVTPLVRRRRLA